MNLKEEIIVAYLDYIEQEDQIWKTGDEFPSFCGGNPVFLEKVEEGDLKCEQCQNMLKFLLQLYAPLEFEYATYRCLYIFYCQVVQSLYQQSKQCLRNPNRIKVIRQQSQTLVINKNQKIIEGLRFSTENPMIVSPEIVDPKYTNKLLRFAKQLLPDKKKSSKPNCKIKINIQEQAQQNYKQESDDEDDDKDLDEDEGWEDTTYQSQIPANHNPDVVESSSSSGDDQNYVKQDLPKEQKIYDRYLAEAKTKTKVEQAIEFSELNDFEKDAKNNIDGNFLIYQHFITEQENHILRYCFSAASQPLWFSDKQQFTTKDIPNCSKCGAKKNFEVQINNSILSFYKELYGLEWGALFIYSCSKSCKSASLTLETLLMQYDDHDEQFSDVSVDSAHIKSQIQELKKNSAKPKKQKVSQAVIKEETKFAEDDNEDW